jgi:hypothetical protein
LVSKTIKSFIYMGCGVNKLIFGITGTEEPGKLRLSDMISPARANEIRARTQIFKAMPETGITEGYRLKLSIESPRL